MSRTAVLTTALRAAPGTDRSSRPDQRTLEIFDLTGAEAAVYAALLAVPW